MAVLPLVRYFILCEDCRRAPLNSRSIDIFGLLCNLRSAAFPVTLPQLTAVAVLADVRKPGEIWLSAHDEETDNVIWQMSSRHPINPAGPLDLQVKKLKVVGCGFPSSARYLIRLWFDESVIASQALWVRAL